MSTTQEDTTDEVPTDEKTATDKIRLLAEAEARIKAVQDSIDRDNDARTPLGAARDALREAETALVDKEIDAACEALMDTLDGFGAGEQGEETVEETDEPREEPRA